MLTDASLINAIAYVGSVALNVNITILLFFR